ncbi:hypothetical protein [Chitinolyticbacter albus]|uniref:hypothetical protein n=1 Tax=Chitinolyticbacter albus TaxID=2961951 RepID=UPI00210D1792|nr:hypothetical protein [Chitinolyticbacter albus]
MGQSHFPFVAGTALADEIHPKYCVQLRDAKTNIEQQQRQRSTQALRTSPATSAIRSTAISASGELRSVLEVRCA